MQRFELHYELPGSKHSMEAFAFVKAESELIHLIKDVSDILGLEVSLEATALREGGIRQAWGALGKNAPQISVLLAALTIVMTLKPKSDHDLMDLQKEKLRLEIQVLKKELNESESVPPIKLIEAAAQEMNDEIKVVKRRSNYYQILNGTPDIINVSFEHYDENDELRDTKTVPRPEFLRYAALSGDLTPVDDEEAVVEIVSPVLKRGNFKWKGFYKDELIDFKVYDKGFVNEVVDGKREFHNGTAIRCILKMKRKVNEVGEIIYFGYSTSVVTDIIEESNYTETKSGKSYRARKKEQDRQTTMF